MSELKNCPFCGGKARYYQEGFYTGGSPDDDHVVECSKCFADVWDEKSKEGVIEKWNTRQSIDVDALKELINEQAEDEGLWFIAKYATEGYLQAALRKVHSVCEDALQEEDPLKKD